MADQVDDLDGATYIDPSLGAAVEYAYRIVLEFFGEQPAAVCKLLLSRGPSTLREVKQSSGLGRVACSHALIVLLQHSYVQALTRDQLGAARSIISDTVYKADASRVLASVRQPAFLMHVADALGEAAERVCAHFVHNGRLSFRQLVHIVAAEAQGDAAADVESQCADIVTELFTGRLLEQVPPCGLPLVERPDAYQKVTRARAKTSADQRALDAAHQLSLETYSKARYTLPEAVHAAQLRGGGGMDVDGPAAAGGGEEEPPLRLNFEAFTVHFRHTHCVDFIAAAQSVECARVARAILDLSLPHDLENINLSPDKQSLSTVRADQVVARCREAPDAAEDMAADISAAAVQQALQRLVEMQSVVEEDDGSYSFDQSTTLHAMQQLAVSSYVKRRFGEHGLRLWRLLTECPYLPLDQIERHALIGLRETRTLVYSLFAQGYVAVQELPKSAERIPSRTLYLYYTTAKITYTQFITDTYAAAARLLMRGAFEQERRRGVLALVKRKLEGDSGLKMTAAQLATARHVQAVMNALSASLLQLDGMLSKFSDVAV